MYLKDPKIKIALKKLKKYHKAQNKVARVAMLSAVNQKIFAFYAQYAILTNAGNALKIQAN